jgi:CrcB protein
MNPWLSGFIAVGLGSALGGWARWGLSVWLNPRHEHFYLGTYAANAVGGFLVGLAAAFFLSYPNLSPAWRLFAITGFLGGLTTFSSYSAEVVGLMQRGEIGWAVTVAITHLVTSLVLTAVGFATYRAMAGLS